MNPTRRGNPSGVTDSLRVDPAPTVGPLGQALGRPQGAQTSAHHQGRSLPIGDHHPMGPMDRPAPDSPPSVDGYPTVPSVAGNKPKTCRCAAYRWPHRPGGGLCRWPDPPAGEHPTPAGTNRPNAQRRRGLRRTIMREYGLHPIRDRAAIERLLEARYRFVRRAE